MALSAFVSAVPAGTSFLVSSSKTTRCPVRPAPTPRSGALSLRASSVKEQTKDAVQSRIAEREALRNLGASEPQGFTSYAEKVNGRIAMMGFFIGLVTEVVSKDHVTIGQQMLIMFSPLVNLIHALS